MKASILKASIYLTLRIIFLGLAKILLRYEVRGAGNIPATGGAIIVSNHASYLDPPLIGMGIQRPIFYFAKEELFRTVLGPLFTFVNAIPVNRDQLDRKTLKRVLEVLTGGKIILMFPEGTRTLTGDLQPGKPGVSLIAYHSRVPVIPAYIQGSYNILPRDKKIIRFTKCSVTFGPPIHLDPFFQREKTKELYSQMSQEIMAGIQKLKDMSSGV